MNRKLILEKFFRCCFKSLLFDWSRYVTSLKDRSWNKDVVVYFRVIAINVCHQQKSIEIVFVFFLRSSIGKLYGLINVVNCCRLFRHCIWPLKFFYLLQLLMQSLHWRLFTDYLTAYFRCRYAFRVNNYIPVTVSICSLLSRACLFLFMRSCMNIWPFKLWVIIEPRQSPFM